MSPDRGKVEAWWKSPLVSIVLVIAGVAVIFIEVARGPNADAGGYAAGLALVGLGITGRIQNWAQTAEVVENIVMDVVHDDTPSPTQQPSDEVITTQDYGSEPKPGEIK